LTEPLVFTPPRTSAPAGPHHKEAADRNLAATRAGLRALSGMLDDPAAGGNKILLRAAAGAGKSYALRDMVADALSHPRCQRVVVTAFTNKQIWPLAGKLGAELGAENVCLLVSARRLAEVPPEVTANATVATTSSQVPADIRVLLGVAHRLGAPGEQGRLKNHLDPPANDGFVADVLLVDEAWQMPLYLYDKVQRLAPISVGVGDVGQLPPLDPTQNPWRGDPGYNPYRAWPTAFEHAAGTTAIDLPAVWRPHAAQLALWQAFYNDWPELNCIAAPDDRTIALPDLASPFREIWEAVATGVPTLLEIAGLEDAEAPDIDQPLLEMLERLLEPLIAAGFSVSGRTYADDGTPTGTTTQALADQGDNTDPLIVLLATRNQAVDDATELAERLTGRYDLPDGALVASTVDSWQGQTNAITIAIHPLSGASRLDDFNSAFGRIAVTCTRATHGLLILARTGLDDLLENAVPKPGTPFGEPGPRALPRQTHQRILDSFARATIDAHDLGQ
jgi:hypothetical protein